MNALTISILETPRGTLGGSFPHLLITALSLSCGYPASSIRERVYAIPRVGFGILLYTGTSDSEGTLGGLVQVGRRIHETVKSALEIGALCSNDPVCAQHEPGSRHERRFLHGAACHGCLFISETSCEQQNGFWKGYSWCMGVVGVIAFPNAAKSPTIGQFWSDPSSIR